MSAGRVSSALLPVAPGVVGVGAGVLRGFGELLSEEPVFGDSSGWGEIVCALATEVIMESAAATPSMNFVIPFLLRSTPGFARSGARCYRLIALSSVPG